MMQGPPGPAKGLVQSTIRGLKRTFAAIISKVRLAVKVGDYANLGGANL